MGAIISYIKLCAHMKLGQYFQTTKPVWVSPHTLDSPELFYQKSPIKWGSWRKMKGYLRTSIKAKQEVEIHFCHSYLTLILTEGQER